MVDDWSPIMDDNPSLAAALRDDPRARERFVAEHRDWAVRYARRRGAGQDAEDIAHAALLAVIERPPAALDRVHPRAILAVKIRDRVALRWRSLRHEVSLSEAQLADARPGVRSEVNLRELLRKLASALHRLRTREREVLSRRFLEEERAVDMVETGETPAAVRGRVFRALDSLRGQMLPRES